MKTIVLATDGSPSAAQATATAIEVAQATGAPLHVVTAWSIPASAFGFAPVTIVPEVADDERTQAERAAASAVEQAEAAGIAVTAEVRHGLAVEEVDRSWLDRHDYSYPVIIGVNACRSS